MPGFRYFVKDTRGPGPNPEVPTYKVEHCCGDPEHVKLWITDDAGRILAVHETSEKAMAMLERLRSGDLDAKQLLNGLA